MADTTAIDAMILWECLLDWYMTDKRPAKHRGSVFNEYRDNNGACQTRDMLAFLVPAFSADWKMAQSDFDYTDSIDWDFAPFWLLKCVDPDTWNVRPNRREIIQKFCNQSK